MSKPLIVLLTEEGELLDPKENLWSPMYMDGASLLSHYTFYTKAKSPKDALDNVMEKALKACEPISPATDKITLRPERIGDNQFSIDANYYCTRK